MPPRLLALLALESVVCCCCLVSCSVSGESTLNRPTSSGAPAAPAASAVSAACPSCVHPSSTSTKAAIRNSRVRLHTLPRIMLSKLLQTPRRLPKCFSSCNERSLQFGVKACLQSRRSASDLQSSPQFSLAQINSERKPDKCAKKRRKVSERSPSVRCYKYPRMVTCRGEPC